jgi:hypothetical protein
MRVRDDAHGLHIHGQFEGVAGLVSCRAGRNVNAARNQREIDEVARGRLVREVDAHRRAHRLRLARGMKVDLHNQVRILV